MKQSVGDIKCETLSCHNADKAHKQKLWIATR